MICTPAYHANPPWLVKLVSPKAGGGRLRESDLAVIAGRPDTKALIVSGLDQATFGT